MSAGVLCAFALDRPRDVQVGGLDNSKENMQWLERSVNRSVGAQLRNQGRRNVQSPSSGEESSEGGGEDPFSERHSRWR